MQKQTLLLVMAVAILASCQASPNGALMRNLTPEKGQTADSFSFEIESRHILDEDGFSELETEQGKLKYKANQIMVALKNTKKLDKLLAKHDLKVLEQETIPSVPGHTERTADGDLINIPPSGFVKLPRYLLEYAGADESGIEELQDNAKKLGLHGHYKFQDRRAAVVFNKAMAVQLDSDNEVEGSGINYLTAPNSATIEGRASSTSSNETSPNLGKFWWVAREGYYGANINTTNSDAIVNYSKASGVKVAIIDSGYFSDSEAAIPGSIISNSNYYYFNGINSSANINGPGADSEEPWHGRWCSSVLFAPWNDQYGTIGTASEATKLVCKTDYQQWRNDQCLNTAINFGVKVINMSYSSANYLWGMSFDHGTIQTAYNQGIILVASAGNGGFSTALYPAAYSEVLGIGATDEYGKRADWGYDSHGNHLTSNYANVDLWAPGKNIATANIPGDHAMMYRTIGGTSIAAPIVAGVIACMVQRFPQSVYNYSTARSWIRSKADQYPLGTEIQGWSDNLGLNALKAVRGY